MRCTVVSGSSERGRCGMAGRPHLGALSGRGWAYQGSWRRHSARVEGICSRGERCRVGRPRGGRLTFAAWHRVSIRLARRDARGDGSGGYGWVHLLTPCHYPLLLLLPTPVTTDERHWCGLVAAWSHFSQNGPDGSTRIKTSVRRVPPQRTVSTESGHMNTEGVPGRSTPRVPEASTSNPRSG
jgi:hypothetical protein